MAPQALIAEARAQVGGIADKSMREKLIASLADALDGAVRANAMLAKENEECMRAMRHATKARELLMGDAELLKKDRDLQEGIAKAAQSDRDMWQAVAIRHSKTIDELNQAAIDAEFGE